jgi:uncharacterized integral membrane protein
MESVQILAKANTKEDAPYDWMIFPLVRGAVVISIIGWFFGALFSGLFFALLISIMIPHNYQSGVFSIIFSTLILAAILFVCLGSLWALFVDLRRLVRPKKHLIVITPEDFVKQEGEKVTHIPLEYIKYVTARGAPPVDRSLETARQDANPGNAGESISSLITGRRIAESGRKGLGSKRMRTPTTLAFIDVRTDKEVVVATDKTYGDPYLIAAYIKQYATAKIARNA